MNTQLNLSNKIKSNPAPFYYCKLNRKKNAEVLTTIINNYDEGFVLAINNKWGTGKTTFVEMWRMYLELPENNITTIYFNAWENDFEDNPLVAILGELKSLDIAQSEEFNKILKRAAKISKHILPTLVKAVANKYIDSDVIVDLLTSTSEAAVEIFEDEINEYTDRKSNITEFKLLLQEYIEKHTENNKLVFIIDELDRCRPNYAVSLLEQIKHFFSIDNIYFVLSIDKEQLGHAVRGVYGNIDINADEYLRRFIDIEYSLPSPDKENYYKHLYEIFNLDSFFIDEARTKNRIFEEDKSSFLETCEVLFKNNQIELRKQEKIFTLIKVSLSLTNKSEKINPYILVLLAFIKIQDNSFYSTLKNRSQSLEELQERFHDLFKNNIDSDSLNTLLIIESFLIITYNDYKKPKRNIAINEAQIGFDGFIFRSKIDFEENNLKNISNNIFNRHWYFGITMDDIINKIELLEGIKLP